jgi:phage gp45-like
MAQMFRCGCGEWTGESCDWTGPLDEMVVVEYMPEAIRETHIAAGNSGVYPHNGSIRVAVELECAERAVEIDGEWVEIVDDDPADYVGEPV